jgi:hypothetical protein
VKNERKSQEVESGSLAIRRAGSQSCRSGSSGVREIADNSAFAQNVTRCRNRNKDLRVQLVKRRGVE